MSTSDLPAAPPTTRLPGGSAGAAEAGSAPTGPRTWFDPLASFSRPSHSSGGVTEIKVNLPSIPGYEILAELGRGGMGIVFLARDTRLKREVAIKMLPGGVLADEEQQTRFRSEAQAIAKLTHPGIVQIYEVGTAEQCPFIVLEFVGGGNLRQRAKGKPQDPRWAAEMVAHLADAMDYAHEQGIIHRDLKPANVLLAGTGKEAAQAKPKITDFGLAKFDRGRLGGEDAGGTPTRTGEVVGTPNYMAPEQARGVSTMVTPLVDIYSLGAILYELLTGRPPYEGTTPMETLIQLLNEDILPPRRLQSKIPRDLETICLRCLHREPPRRYARAADLAADLRRFLAGEPILARPTPSWERAWKWARRRPAAAALLVTTFLALAALTGGGWYYNRLLAAALQKARLAEQASAQSAELALKNAEMAAQQERLALESLSTMVYDLQNAFVTIPETRPLRQTLLKKAMAGLEKVAIGYTNRPRDLARATAHARLAENYGILGQRDLFDREAKLGLEIALELHAQNPTDFRPARLAHRLLIVLGEQELNANRPVEARAYFQRALAIAKEVLEALPKDPAAKGQYGQALEKLAHSYHWQNLMAEARQGFAEYSAFARRWFQEEPNVKESQDLFVTALNWEGVLAEEANQLDVAEARYEEALGLNTKRLANESSNRTYRRYQIVLISNLQTIAELRRDFPRALLRAEQTEELFRALSDSDSDNVILRCEHADAFCRLGRLHFANMDFEQAAQNLQRGLEIFLLLKSRGKLEGLSVYGVERIAQTQHALQICKDCLLVSSDLDQARARLPLPRLAPALGRVYRQSWFTGRPREDLMDLLLHLQSQNAEEHVAIFSGLSLAIQGHPFRPPQELKSRFSQQFLDQLANTASAHLDRALLQGYRDKGRLKSSDFHPLNELDKIKQRIEAIPDAPAQGK